MDLLYIRPNVLPGPVVLARVVAGLLTAEASAALAAIKPGGETGLLHDTLRLYSARLLGTQIDRQPASIMHVRISGDTVPFFPDSVTQQPLFWQLALRGRQVVEPDGDTPSYLVVFRSGIQGDWHPVRSTRKTHQIVVVRCSPKEEFDHTEFAHMA